jgi:putative SOS response-associated peptidase YedK
MCISIRSPPTRPRSSRCSRVVNRYVGNLPPMPGVFPDYPAPVVRNVGTDRELTMMRWGMPPPPKFGGPPVTNIRNTSSPHWRGWLKPENRCLVPVNSFAEYAPEPNPETKKKDVFWFALSEDRPVFAFAGIWTEFKGDRGEWVSLIVAGFRAGIRPLGGAYWEDGAREIRVPAEMPHVRPNRHCRYVGRQIS